MNPAQKKPPSLDSDRMKIEYHGRHGVLHVTATFPLSQIDRFTERVAEQKREWEEEATRGAESRRTLTAKTHALLPASGVLSTASGENLEREHGE